ncbi:MAG TPA: Tex-like N-terminal domain-containing protein, partial [Desulfobacteraceae bacterium]|nr:Tex-like N-terminal domain-containing protein [Desulfobacteraceae bacterium]
MIKPITTMSQRLTNEIQNPMTIIQTISQETDFPEKQVAAVIELLDQGCTIPFMARYRKEKTGSLDEVALAGIRDRVSGLKTLAARKEAIIKSLKERDLFTKSLGNAIERASSMAGLEDLYEQYRPKKRTRASMAKEKGLEPLARWILNCPEKDPEAEAGKYIDPDRKIASAEEALAGARDIIAEMINDDPRVRGDIRELFFRSALITSTVKKGKKEEGSKYRDYFDWSEPAFKAPSHRVLAMLRGSNESLLTVHVLPSEEKALAIIHRFYLKKKKTSANSLNQIQEAARDAYKRLLSKSIEKESLQRLKKAADEQAVAVFVNNLEQLLLAPPLGEKPILAMDPGFRTGCKVVCLDARGKLLCHDVIFPLAGNGQKAAKTVVTLVQKHGIGAIAVGNGTAGRETEQFVKRLNLPDSVETVMVDESGASI